MTATQAPWLERRLIALGFSEAQAAAMSADGDLAGALAVHALDTSIHGLAGSPASVGVEVVVSTPAATWTIPVPPEFGRTPAVMVFVADRFVIADVVADATTVTVTHPEPTSGSVVLN